MIRVGLLPEKLTSEQTFLLDEYTWAPYSLHLFTVTYSYWGNTPLLHFSPNLGEKQQYKTLKKKKRRCEYFFSPNFLASKTF